MIYIFLFFGNYASGKTHLSRSLTSNVVALASPIRRIAFELFKDEKFYSTNQDNKELPFPVPKVIKKPRTMKQKFYDELMAIIDNYPQTYRGVLQAIGAVGREIDKDYWAKSTKDKIQELIINNQSVICIDDLRYVNEYKVIKKLANSQTKVIPVCLIDEMPLQGYELEKLLKFSEVILDNSSKSDTVKLYSKGFEVLTPVSKLFDTLVFLDQQT